MNGYLVFILGVITISFILDTIVSLLNLQSLRPEVPEEFRDTFDEALYARSQEYTRATTRFGLVQNTIMTPITILFILFGGFNWIDGIARSFTQGTVITGLIFTGLLLLLSGAAGLPFSIYSIFVIEERFGFNTTTVKTFILDILKSIVLGSIIGGPLLALVLWFFEVGGHLAWLYCWFFVVAFILVMQFLAPVVIMPIFNKFIPLEKGELKERISRYARRQNFRMKGIYTMDGSKRSTKLNAFFTGFGKFRRIVFFDTLIDKLTTDEIIAVLAHEMGHYKKKHILTMTAASIIQMGLMLYILSLFINNRGLFEAFGMEHLSVYASLIFFGFLYTPISMVLSIVGKILSRRYEFAADAYAAATTSGPSDLITGLKKLSASNLANLTPHPFHVFLNYSHPPVLERIAALRRSGSSTIITKDEKTLKCKNCGQDMHSRPNDTSRTCDYCRAERESCGCSDE